MSEDRHAKRQQAELERMRPVYEAANTYKVVHVANVFKQDKTMAERFTELNAHRAMIDAIDNAEQGGE